MTTALVTGAAIERSWGACQRAVAFLASGEAATMTGQTICPDGGLVIL